MTEYVASDTEDYIQVTNKELEQQPVHIAAVHNEKRYMEKFRAVSPETTVASGTRSVKGMQLYSG